MEFPANVEQIVAGYAATGAGSLIIARALGISVGHLERRFGGILTKQRALRQLALIGAMTRFAQRGNPALLIFLSKQADDKGGLGLVDEVSFGAKPDFTKMAPDELDAWRKGRVTIRRGKLGLVASGGA